MKHTMHDEIPTAQFTDECGVRTFTAYGEKILWYDYEELSSTMDWARERLKRGCPPWTVVSASSQTKGRGTQGRGWFSPHGKGLWMSIVLPPPLKLESLPDLNALAVEALIETLKHFNNLPFSRKHPNDVIIKNRKIAGVMCESVTRGDSVVSIILGVGLNLLQSREELDAAGLLDATSFALETGGWAPDDAVCIVSFLEHFISVYPHSPSNGIENHVPVTGGV